MLTSGVDYWRIINPYQKLSEKLGWECDIVKKVVDEKDDVEQQFNAVGRRYDVIHSSYIDSPRGYSWLRALCSLYNIPLIVDVDDNLLEVDEMSPVYKEYYPGSIKREFAMTVVSDADYLTVTNNSLAEMYSHYRKDRPRPFVIPNMIDLELFNHPRVGNYPKKNPGDPVKIGWWGSATHYTDFMVIKPVIFDLLKKYPNLTFEFVGLPIEEFDDEPRIIQSFGRPTFNRWVEQWKTYDFDIVVAPLEQMNFNNGKSDIKWQEASAAFMPAVLSNYGPYKRSVTHGLDGLLAKKTSEWRESLSLLIENPALREKIANNAYQYIKQNYSIDRGYLLYKEMIERVVTEKRPWAKPLRLR